MKINKTQVIRHIIQLISFILYPGLFIITWNSFGTIYKAIITGNITLNIMLSPLLVLLAIIPITVIWGRFFCSYVCAFGSMQELINKLGDLLHIKKIKIDYENDKYLKYIKYVIIILSVILWTIDVNISAFSPWNSFGILTSLSNYSSLISVGGLVLLVIMILSLFIDRFFCRYLCPLGGIFSLISIPRLFKIKKNDKCIGCNKCNRVCPMNIDVNDKTNNILKTGECIDCFNCIKDCPKKALYTSTDEAINGTAASLAILGLTFVGNVITENTDVQSVYEEKTTQGSYKDGTYTGIANGYKGEVQVSVVVKNGNITSITVESYRDDSQFFNKAKSTIIDEIISSQSTNVKTVSGATYSSRGIINAVANALSNTSTTNEIETTVENEEKNNNSNNTNENNNNTSESNNNSTINNSSLDFENLKDGTYSGTGKGRNGNIEVSVTVENSKVTDITIISSQEDAQYFSRAKSGIISSVINKQSLNVSTISGATMSSNGILEAIANALDIEFTNNNSSINNHDHNHRH